MAGLLAACRDPVTSPVESMMDCGDGIVAVMRRLRGVPAASLEVGAVGDWRHFARVVQLPQSWDRFGIDTTREFASSNASSPLAT
jgi:hypothetical protein